MIESTKKETCTTGECFCEDPEKCKVMNQYKKLVYCNMVCIHNIPIKAKKHIKHHKDWVPLGEEDAYRGICGRDELGIKDFIMTTIHGYYEIAECKFRSNRKIKGHMDFARLLGSDGRPFGGTIPDPVDPGAAYHI